MSEPFTTKRIVVCADDFGLTTGATAAIEQLASSGAVSAASCVVDGVYCAPRAAALIASSSNLSLGLHLNLSENPNTALNASVVKWLLRTFIVRGVDRERLRAEIARQLNCFETQFRRAPDFVDGHQHLHQFPQVREVLLELLAQRYRNAIAVRATVPQAWRGAKALLIGLLGGRRMQQLLLQNRISHNADFAGVYDFTSRVSFAMRMRAWLPSIADGGLIMCHPEYSEKISSARNLEYAFLNSVAWPQLCAEYRVQLMPFRASDCVA